MHDLAENSRHKRGNLILEHLQRAKGILHLGAHLGQEAQSYAKLDKSVVWVEAMPQIFPRLTKAVEKYPNQRALCALLGNENGRQRLFYISNNHEGVSSSIFQFGQYGQGEKSLWRELNLTMIDTINLPEIRLDSLLTSNNIDATTHDFWVLDLQGSELIALQGAGDLLRHCFAIYIEVSTVEVYKGGVLWPELESWLNDEGFEPLWQPELPHDNVLFLRNRNTHTNILETFHSEQYLRHNQRRLEHLATLRLPLHGREILEVGAGIGDHTSFYLDRGCSVCVSDVRPENLKILEKRFSGHMNVEIRALDLNYSQNLGREFDVIHCYGLLYHLQDPRQGLEFLAEHCNDLLLLESCVSYGQGAEINLITESSNSSDQAYSGTGCRPTRAWIWNTLKELFPYVYMTRTQPAHEQFPLDWDSRPVDSGNLSRMIFIGSRSCLDSNPELYNSLENKQFRI